MLIDAGRRVTVWLARRHQLARGRDADRPTDRPTGRQIRWWQLISLQRFMQRSRQSQRTAALACISSENRCLISDHTACCIRWDRTDYSFSLYLTVAFLSKTLFNTKIDYTIEKEKINQSVHNDSVVKSTS